MPWKPGGWVIAPLVLLAALAMALFVLAGHVHAHMEDAAGCLTIPKVEAAQLVYEGVSEDGRDYIKQYDVRGYGKADMEEHYILLPQPQWKKRQPAYLSKRMSVWLDNDRYAGWDHWFIDPRGMGNCLDYIHLIYDTNLEVWRVHVPHHDDTRIDNKEGAP